MPYFREWNRKIDKIELSDKRMKVTCTDGTVYVGISNGSCMGTDKNGEDVDGVRFKADDGYGYIFIEDDIDKIEFLD